MFLIVLGPPGFSQAEFSRPMKLTFRWYLGHPLFKMCKSEPPRRMCCCPLDRPLPLTAWGHLRDLQLLCAQDVTGLVRRIELVDFAEESTSLQVYCEVHYRSLKSSKAPSCTNSSHTKDRCASWFHRRQVSSRIWTAASAASDRFSLTAFGAKVLCVVALYAGHPVVVDRQSYTFRSIVLVLLSVSF